MKATRILLLCAILLPMVCPAGAALFHLASEPGGWRVWQEADRMTTLIRQTCLLVGGVVLVAIPLGVTGATLLYRTDLAGRRFLLFCTVFALLVPLPLVASGWQTVFGSGGWLEMPWWGGGVLGQWTPWGQGLAAAIWIHALAGAPWVVVIVGQGFLWVEPELEEDALLRMPGWLVFWRVTLPRAKVSIAAAALWLVLQAGGEITITDMMQVRTFAEEVYTQAAIAPSADAYPLARVTAVALPQTLLVAALVVWAVRRWDRALPPRESAGEPRLFQLRSLRWVAALVAGGFILLLTCTPLASLVWRAGYVDATRTWSLAVLKQTMLLVTRTEGEKLLTAILVALVSAVLACAVAMVLIRLASASRRLLLLVLAALAATWAMPGPLLGLGLGECIEALLFLPEPVDRWLYLGPSHVPLIWSNAVRFVPFAAVFLWPVYRLIPPELHDLARLERRSWLDAWRRVILPLMQGPLASATCLVALLCLGEVSASKVVSTAGAPGFAEVIFVQMHFGVTNALAAHCLLLLGVVLPGAALFWWVSLRPRGG